MNKEGVFQIKFEDGTVFVGNLFNKDWRKISDKQRIKEILFSFGERHIKMENYREYNLTFETHVLIGKQPTIVNITLAGRADNNSVLIVFDLTTGQLLRKKVDKYCEYEWICSTWKKGTTQGVAKEYYDR